MKKKTKNILSYPAIFDPVIEKKYKGGFNVSFPDLPGCLTWGKNFEEAERMAKEALTLWLESAIEDGVEIPKRTKELIIHNISANVPTTV